MWRWIRWDTRCIRDSALPADRANSSNSFKRYLCSMSSYFLLVFCPTLPSCLWLSQKIAFCIRYKGNFNSQNGTEVAWDFDSANDVSPHGVLLSQFVGSDLR